MRHIAGRTHRILGTLLVAGLLAGCNTSGGAKSPRVGSIPLQSVGGGATFVLDLSAFVQDDTQTASYAVLSGGGSFTGSVYSHQFPTLGTYTVAFQVTDFRGNKTASTFQVKVTSAELGVVRNGSGVSLFDFATANFVEAIQDDGQVKVFKTALTDGSLVLEVTTTGQADLWLHDPNLSSTDVFAGDSAQPETFGLKTSQDAIVFVKGTAPNRALNLYSPLNKTSIEIGSNAESVRDERDPVLGNNDRIYFESAQGGLADIWYYDVPTQSAAVISDHARDEDIVAVLQNGALVFRRKGDGGEWDLLYCDGTGVVEIGTDLGTTKNQESKTFKAGTADSRVVFETTDAGNDEDLYIWNPATGQTAMIADTGMDETFLAVSGTGRIIHKIQAGPTDGDIRWHNPADNTQGNIATASDDETFNGTLSNGDVIYTRNTGAGGLDLYHWDESTTTATAFPGAGATTTDQVFAKVLGNDDVVYTTGGDLFFFRHSTGTSTSVTTAAGTETFGGETTGGDFVIDLATGGATHLYLWDDSAAATVAVSTVAGVASYQAVSSGGKILFARTPTGASTSDLWSWDPATTTATQVTNNTKDDTVDAVVNAAVN